MNLKSTHPLITPDYGATAPRTAIDFFPCCGAITFFSLLPIKRAASERLEIMQSFTNKADELYLEAENVRLPDYIPPFTSCYETLFQQEELIERARTMEDLARQIRQQFQAIADSGFPVPTSTLLRKAVVSVRKGKFMFSTEQLSRVVQMVMETKPYLLFRPKSNTKDYVILVFWATNFDDTCCNIQENAEAIKKEVLADGFQLRFKVENIPSPRRFIFYMLNNYLTLAVQNDDDCHLPTIDHKQLETFLNLLEEHDVTTPKKRRLTETDSSTNPELTQTAAQNLEDYM